MRIELNCVECGRNRFNLAEASEDDTRIRCYFCGHEIGTMGELKQRLVDEVMKRSSSEGAPA